MSKPTPTRQLPACEAVKLGVLLPYFHPVERDHLPVDYHLTLLKLTPEELDALVLLCRKKAAIVCPNPLDNRTSLDYPPTNREKVNTLRHSCLNRTAKNCHQLNGYSASYDSLLYRIEKKGVDVAARHLDLKLSVLRLIAETYPDLAVECAEQRFHAIRKFQGEEF